MDTDEQREHRRKIFEESGMPQPDGVIISARYMLDNDDWYVQLEGDTWYWYDKDSRKWKLTMYGPL